MERTFIQWNIVNWITVVLMVSIGMAVVQAAVSIWRQYASGDAAMSAD